MNNYYVYIITNKTNGTLYFGVTNNPKIRIFEHKNKILEGFSKKYGLNKLVFYESFEDIEYAIAFEKKLKRWKRQWKLELIEKGNLNWKDLFNDL